MSVAIAEHEVITIRRDRRFLLLLAAAALCAATTVTVAIAVTGLSDDPASVALVRGLTVALSGAAGLYAWYWRVGERFGLALLGMAALLFVTSFAESSSSVPYTIGRIGG